MPPRKKVDARVVEVDEHVKPVDAVVVGDKRSTFGRRLGIFALVLIVLFFVISGYIQSAKNGAAVRKAAIHNSRKNDKLINSLDDQRQLIKQLQQAIRAQNRELAKAGFQTVQVPGDQQPASSGQHNPSNPSPTPQPGHSPKPTPHPKPSPTHSPRPPSKDPVTKVKDRVCSLTGICTIDTSNWFIF